MMKLNHERDYRYTNIKIDVGEIWWASGSNLEVNRLGEVVIFQRQSSGQDVYFFVFFFFALTVS